ncbi:hypothetical protein K3495_g7001 [Podosphaera aphanis]|nr:hypothetical protein K3495_g7001 [Podosphaera aphanis]
MAGNYQQILESLQDLQNEHELSIIKLSEPLSGIIEKRSEERISDVSTEVFKNPTPASLEADLSHYKELFSKLRFSYLEQVTKEKFIRAIVGDPPLIVEHQENVELEASLAESKATLKSLKAEVSDLVSELEKNGRELCRKYESIKLQTAQLKDLPSEIEELQNSIETLKASQQIGADRNLMMPLNKTLSLIDQREKERAELDQELGHLQLMVSRKTKELERLNSELQPLEAKRSKSKAYATEAQKRKNEALGGGENDLDQRGRWWRGVEIGLKGMLGIES